MHFDCAMADADEREFLEFACKSGFRFTPEFWKGSLTPPWTSEPDVILHAPRRYDLLLWHPDFRPLPELGEPWREGEARLSEWECGPLIRYDQGRTVEKPDGEKLLLCAHFRTLRWFGSSAEWDDLEKMRAYKKRFNQLRNWIKAHGVRSNPLEDRSRVVIMPGAVRLWREGLTIRCFGSNVDVVPEGDSR